MIYCLKKKSEYVQGVQSIFQLIHHFVNDYSLIVWLTSVLVLMTMQHVGNTWGKRIFKKVKANVLHVTELKAFRA